MRQKVSDDRFGRGIALQIVQEHLHNGGCAEVLAHDLGVYPIGVYTPSASRSGAGAKSAGRSATWPERLTARVVSGLRCLLRGNTPLCDECGGRHWDLQGLGLLSLPRRAGATIATGIRRPAAVLGRCSKDCDSRNEQEFEFGPMPIVGCRLRRLAPVPVGIRISVNPAFADCVLNCVLTGTGIVVESGSTGAGNRLGDQKNRVTATWEGAFRRRFRPVEKVAPVGCEWGMSSEPVRNLGASIRWSGVTQPLAMPLSCAAFSFRVANGITGAWRVDISPGQRQIISMPMRKLNLPKLVETTSKGGSAGIEIETPGASKLLSSLRADRRGHGLEVAQPSDQRQIIMKTQILYVQCTHATGCQ